MHPLCLEKVWEWLTYSPGISTSSTIKHALKACGGSIEEEEEACFKNDYTISFGS
jgi:hypothetical protein